MTSVASTGSDTSATVIPEQIAEATTLKQLQALLKSVDPSGSKHTTKKQALTALIGHTIKQARDADVPRATNNDMELLEATVASLDVPAIQNSLAELKALTESLGPAPMGPTEKHSVQALLATDDAISAAIERFGAEWVCSVQQHWTRLVLRHPEAMEIWTSHVQALETGMCKVKLLLLLMPVTFAFSCCKVWCVASCLL